EGVLASGIRRDLAGDHLVPHQVLGPHRRPRQRTVGPEDEAGDASATGGGQRRGRRARDAGQLHPAQVDVGGGGGRLRGGRRRAVVVTVGARRGEQEPDGHQRAETTAHRIGSSTTVAAVPPPGHRSSTCSPTATLRATTARATGPRAGETAAEVTRPTSSSPRWTDAPGSGGRSGPASIRRPRTGRGTLPPRLSIRATSSWPV